MTDYLHNLDDTVYWNADAEHECNLRAQEQSRSLYVLAIREDIRHHNERMQAKVLKQSIGLGGLKYEKSERAEHTEPQLVERKDAPDGSGRQCESFWSRFGTRRWDR
jgi:hypothetical protein